MASVYEMTRQRNEYNRKYYQAHKEYFAEYQKKYKARKAA